MQRILIANRGEIAVRIVRACADLGLTSIAVHSDPDAEALHVRLADEAFALPGSSAAETYLDIDALLAVARRCDADAVHPGYGFRSESADFARAVIDAGLIWIGPSPRTIETLGDKVAARQVAARVGAPLVPGTPGPLESAAEAVDFAEEHGLPIVIKAAHGGGGRGMRVVRELSEVGEQFEAARREAIQAFGRGECFVERFLDRPRHVEVQVLADAHGTVLALGTRDCSLQRRNQKLVEEAPAPFLTSEQTERLLRSAEQICAAADYQGAGTVEFLLAPAADGATMSFLEVNTRLQVEHPVTEETTDLDLVGWQLRIAAGERLDPTLAPRRPRGHALEFRINAEDPGRGFLPSPGRITRFAAPSGPGVRVDAALATAGDVPPQYDSLIAKLVVWGPDRATAIARARRALAECEIEGVATVLEFHRAVLAAPEFVEEFAVHTRWIESEFAVEGRFGPAPAPTPSEPALRSTWIEIDGRRVRLGLPADLTLGAAGSTVAEPSEPGLTASVPGSLVRWLVDDGAEVAEGDPVVLLEAMKMETTVDAPRSGTLHRVASEGDALTSGQLLATID